MAIWQTMKGVWVWITNFIPMAVLPAGLMCLYKLVVGIIAKCKRGENGVDKLHFPDSLDCVMATDLSEKQPEGNLGFVLIIQGRIGVEEMRDHFKKCFLNEDSNGDRYEKLYSHLECFGGYVFRATAETLDVNEHVVDLEQIESSKLKDFIDNWKLKEWKSLKPCWELVVIPLDDGERTGIAFKIHQVFADQYSLLHILDKFTGSSSPPLVTAFEQSGLTQLRQILEGPLHFPELNGMHPSLNPFRVTLNPEQEKSESLVVFTSVKLEEMERLCKKYGVENDTVLLTLISGALRKFLEEEGKDVNHDVFCAGVSFPWPKHSSQQASTSNKNKLCNHWVSLILKVPLRKATPQWRTQAIATQLHELQLELGLDMFYRRVIAPLCWSKSRRSVEKEANFDNGVGVGLDSLVGAEEGYSLLGKEVTNVHFYNECSDSNAFVAFGCFSFSHRGKLELTFFGDSSVFKNQQRFNHLCQKLIPDELDEFLRVSMASESSPNLESSRNPSNMV